MMITKTICLYCISENVRNRLQSIFEQMSASKHLPFYLEILPSLDPDRKIEFIFFETNPEWFAANDHNEFEQFLKCSKSNVALIINEKSPAD